MDQNTLRALQLCELGILKEVKRVCEKHEITYYLSSGTLLGAVRHKGFIPWDDDIDIEMPYEDYQRFLSVAQLELGDQYFVQNCDTDSGFYFAYTKIRKNGTLMMSPWEQEDVGNHGVWIDVFPLTTVSSKRDGKIKRTFVTLSNYLLMPEKSFKHSESWIRSQSSSTKFVAVKMIRKLPLCIRRAIRKRMMKFVFRTHGKNGHTEMVWGNVTNRCMPDVYAGEKTQLLFEDDYFDVPPKYHEYLSYVYGDYMTPPPENQRDGGHGEVIIQL